MQSPSSSSSFSSNQHDPLGDFLLLDDNYIAPTSPTTTTPIGSPPNQILNYARNRINTDPMSGVGFISTAAIVSPPPPPTSPASIMMQTTLAGAASLPEVPLLSGSPPTPTMLSSQTILQRPNIRVDTSLKETISSMNWTLSNCEQALQHLLAQFCTISTRLDNVSTRLETVELQMKGVVACVDEIHKKIDEQARHHNEQNQLMSEYRKIREYAVFRHHQQQLQTTTTGSNNSTTTSALSGSHQPITSAAALAGYKPTPFSQSHAVTKFNF